MQLIVLVLFAGVALVANVEGQTETRTMVPFETLTRGPPNIPLARNARVDLGTFPTKLDNNIPNSATFQLRYYQNLEFAVKDAPIFIYVGGEWTISPGSLSSGQIYEMARENRGAMFYLEHRYYGQSVPTSDLSTGNLKWHDSRQAIQDIIAFYNWLRTYDFYRNSKLVLIGCSYSASLATFTKQAYPNTVTAVYATSGPLYATMDMYQYLQVVTDVIQRTNSQCANVIRDAISTMQTLYDQGRRDQLHASFKVCKPPTYHALDRDAFFERFAVHYASMVQSNKGSIRSECNRLLSSAGTTSMDKFINYFAPGAGSCVAGTYAHFPGTYTNIDKSSETRAWGYQQCNEFGWFVTTNGNQQAFGSSVRPRIYYQTCRDAFKRTDWTDSVIEQKMYRSNQLNNVINAGSGLNKVVFMYGTDDPWAPMGRNLMNKSDTITFNIQDGSHCQDMGAHSSSDTQSMTNAKRGSREWIKYWLQ